MPAQISFTMHKINVRILCLTPWRIHRRGAHRWRLSYTGLVDGMLCAKQMYQELWLGWGTKLTGELPVSADICCYKGFLWMTRVQIPGFFSLCSDGTSGEDRTQTFTICFAETDQWTTSLLSYLVHKQIVCVRYLNSHIWPKSKFWANEADSGGCKWSRHFATPRNIIVEGSWAGMKGAQGLGK